MPWYLWTLFGIVDVLFILVLIIATRPDKFTISRKRSMAAPAALIYDQVNDLHRWVAWSPFEKMDPNAKKTFTGPPAGQGASYAWDGNNKAGAGKMTCLEAKPAELLRYELAFTRPFAATNLAVFTFKKVDDKTEVTWSMSGTHNFFGKAFALFCNMDKIVGGEFANGLEKLDQVSQDLAKKA